ncbi:uncharacterized protein LOC144103804 [Amblyomma americanum]
MSSKRLSCKECCMQFTGPVPYMDHMQSARHRKKMAALNQTDAAPATGGNATAPASNGKEAKHPAAGLKHPLPFVCKLCNMAMNCETALIAHNKGKRHQRALKSQEVFRQSGEQSATKASSPPWPQSSEEGVDLSCEYCGIVLFKNLDSKLKHLETDSHHQNKLQAVGKRESDGECDQPLMKRPKTDYQGNETAEDPNEGYYGGEDETRGPNNDYYAGEDHPDDPNDGFYPGQYH